MRTAPGPYNVTTADSPTQRRLRSVTGIFLRRMFERYEVRRRFPLPRRSDSPLPGFPARITALPRSSRHIGSADFRLSSPSPAHVPQLLSIPQLPQLNVLTQFKRNDQAAWSLSMRLLLLRCKLRRPLLGVQRLPGFRQRPPPLHRWLRRLLVPRHAGRRCRRPRPRSPEYPTQRPPLLLPRRRLRVGDGWPR